MASQWPPRSPREALLGTPGGRERVRRLYERASPSPSPSPSKSRALRAAPTLVPRPADAGLTRSHRPEELNDDDENDDEETLQLKLQAIEARLKLKRLQAAKASKAVTAASDRGGPPRPASQPAPVSSGSSMEVPLQSRLAAARERMERLASQNTVQVPASPIRKAQGTAELETSPRRIQLGIDKGLRAADVSLKRAPSLRSLQEKGQQGGYLRRSKTPIPGAGRQSPAPRPASFNERIASARSQELARQERQDRIRQLRSTAFNVGQQEMDRFKSEAADLPDMPSGPEEFSREEIIASASRQTARLRRSNTAPSIRPRTELSDTPGPPHPTESATKDKVAPADVAESDASAFEPYSGLHLSKRILPHGVLTRAVSGKKTYLIRDLLQHVKAPDWSLPDVEQDIVVLAIIASKSDPRNHKPGPGVGGKPRQDRGKYMVMTLVDLSYEVELFLFNSGFERFWKLTTGTVVAILNPSIMPPPAGREATGRFSLIINSDADTIIEIGNSRDLGYCKSVKRDGELCRSWINAKRTEYCEFHTNEAVRRARGSRMELNSMGFGADGPRHKQGSQHANHRPRGEHNRGYDRDTQTRWFVSDAGRQAGLGDDEREGGLADRAEREETLKRRLARQERERDIAKRLGQIGRGAGQEYMSRAATAVPAAPASGKASSSGAGGLASKPSQRFGRSTAARGDRPPLPDARALGLVAPRGEQPRIDLGTIKRKRPDSSQSSSTANSSSLMGGKAALGWGSLLKDKLTRMKDGEALGGARGPPATDADLAAQAGSRADGSPVRKKTRFVTEKGIREAGRESLGEPLSLVSRGRQVELDDDDDDLIIVK